jgi:hypothetical protein
MILAISNKPKVFGSLLISILNSDHLGVSFETVLTARKWPIYERAFPKNNSAINHYCADQLTLMSINIKLCVFSVAQPKFSNTGHTGVFFEDARTNEQTTQYTPGK